MIQERGKVWVLKMMPERVGAPSVSQFLVVEDSTWGFLWLETERVKLRNMRKDHEHPLISKINVENISRWGNGNFQLLGRGWHSFTDSNL